MLLDTQKVAIRTVEKLEESMDLNTSYYMFLVLTMLILLSLIGTYYFYSNPIHKVLALLFMSVQTVMLWMWETPFLFVYIVYILAFIGAVLMLFLSVVLMLPISSIHYKGSPFLMLAVMNIDFRSPSLRPPHFESSHFSSSFEIPTSDEILDPKFFVFATFAVLVYAGLIRLCAHLFRNRNEFRSWRNFRRLLVNFWYVKVILSCHVYRVTWPMIPGWRPHTYTRDLFGHFYQDEYGYIKRYFKSFTPESGVVSAVPPTDAYFMSRYPRFDEGVDLQLYYWLWASFEVVDSLNPNERVRGRFLPFTLASVRSPWFDPLIKKSNIVRRHYRRLLGHLNFLIILAATLYVAALDTWAMIYLKLVAGRLWLLRNFPTWTGFVENLTQLILFVSITACSIPSQFANRSRRINSIPDTEGGLENIKSLLYEDFNLFLIISTVVLLVALIGAAVMTRNKK